MQECNIILANTRKGGNLKDLKDFKGPKDPKGLNFFNSFVFFRAIYFPML